MVLKIRIVIALALLVVFNTARSQKKLTREDFKKYSHTFSIDDGEISGDGAAVLMKSISNAHITALADNYGSVREIEFSKALMSELSNQHYETIAMEIGAGSGHVVNRMMNQPEGIQASLRQLNNKYKLSIADNIYIPIVELKSQSAAALLQTVKDDKWKLISLGVDHWASISMLLHQLYHNLPEANKSEHRQLFVNMESEIQQLYDTMNKFSSEEITTLFNELKESSAIGIYIESMSDYSQNKELIDHLNFAIEYWTLYGDRNYALKNKLETRRNKVMLKSSLAAQEFQFGSDKLFVKLNRRNFSKGPTSNGYYGIGNMLYEMADFHNTSSVYIVMFRRFYSDNGDEKDLVDSDDVMTDRLSQLMELGQKDAWVLVDLRSMVADFYYSRMSAPAAIQDLFFKYDFLVIPKSDLNAIPNYTD